MDQSRLDSLKQFFESEYFTPEMTIQYLYKHRNEPQILELLTHKLSTWQEGQIIFYCPQLCFMELRYRRLEPFFLKTCAGSMALFFSLYWQMSAYSKRTEPEERFQRCMEMAMVNRGSDDHITQLEDKVQIEQFLLQRYQEKEFRSHYFTEVQKFVGTLIKMSLVLKQFPKNDTKHHLKLFIQKTNQTLHKLYKTYKTGITIPILPYGENSQSTTIIRILDKHAICFHTKKRVPYLILVETIDQSEIPKYQIIPQQTIPNIEIDGFVEQNLNDVKFEKQLAQIESEEYRVYHEALEKIMNMEKKGKRQSQILESIDHIVKKQQMIDETLQSISEKPSKTRKSQSLEKNEQKSQQFIQALPKLLPANKQYLSKRFKKPKILWGQTWQQKIAEYRKHSQYNHFPSYRIRAIIIKGGDDLRMEMVALQIMSCFNNIFQKAGLNLFLRPYNICVTSANSGIIEYIPNTLSIDALKKQFGEGTKTLLQIYKEVFAANFEEAQKNFIESLASYSLFTYLMQVKDRHNGNILIDDQGHIIHIDFGYILQCSPGGVNFESAPFKLTQEYVELMRGQDSDLFGYWRTLLIKGFLELKKYMQDFTYLLQVMIDGSDLPCFQQFDLKSWQSRFMQSSTDLECMAQVDKLIHSALYSWRTAQYDNFQKRTNGIIP